MLRKIITAMLALMLAMSVFSVVAIASTRTAPKAMRGTWYSYSKVSGFPNGRVQLETIKIVVGKKTIKEYYANNGKWKFKKGQMKRVKYGDDGLYYKSDKAVDAVIGKPNGPTLFYVKGTRKIQGKKHTYLFWGGIGTSGLNYARSKHLAKINPMIVTDD